MADTPDQAKEALQHITAALTAQTDNLGAIQNGLHDAVAPMLAANKEAIKSIKTQLNRTGNKVVRSANKVVAATANALGTSLQTSMQPLGQQVSQMGAAAVGGGPKKTTLAGESNWCVALLCDGKGGGTLSAIPYDSIPDYVAKGWQIIKCNFITQPGAQAWIDDNHAGLMAHYCPPAKPAGGAPAVPGGGGAAVGGGPGAPATAGCWTVISQPQGQTPPNCPAGCLMWSAGSVEDTQWTWAINCCPGVTEADGPWNIPAPVPNVLWPADAADWLLQPCISTGAPPPPPPQCPPPPTCPTVPVITAKQGDCPISIPALTCAMTADGKLPQVGSPEWCACMDAVSAWLDGIGQWVVSKIDSILNESDPSSEYASWGAAYATLGASLITSALWGALEKTLFGSTDQTRCLWNAVKAMVTTYASQSSPRLLGLTVCRTLLRALHRLRTGWDLALVGTVDLEVSFRPLEQLLDYIESYNFQYEIPAVGDAIECYLWKTAPDEQVVCWMASHGANIQVYEPVIDARREKLAAWEWIQLRRREGADDAIITDELTARGWYRNLEAAGRVELSYGLPTISEHLHWLQRNVFDDAYVQGYDLLNGFDAKFWPKFGHDLHALGVREEYARLHYAAHWIIPARGELAEMMMRLRPGRVDPSIQFTSDDFRNLLAEQDIAPWYRARLQAIAYRTFPLRQLNQLAQNGQFTLDELGQRWQDIGFTADDAKLQAQSTMWMAARQRASQLNGYTPRFVAELFLAGIYDRFQVAALLKPLGYNDDDALQLINAANDRVKLDDWKQYDEKAAKRFIDTTLKALRVGVMDANAAVDQLVSYGYTQKAALLEASTIQAEIQMETVKLAETAVHKAFRYGAITPTEANVALNMAGVQADFAGVLVRRWQLEMTVPRVSASTAAILRWTKKGLMSVANALIRLRNLGWGEADAELQLAEVEQAIQQAQQLAATKRAAALAKAKKLAQQAIASANKQMCKVYSQAKLKRWYVIRSIDDSYVRDKLSECGYDPAAIDNILRDFQTARTAADHKAAAKGAAGVQYTGPGAVPGGPPA